MSRWPAAAVFLCVVCFLGTAVWLAQTALEPAVPPLPGISQDSMPGAGWRFALTDAGHNAGRNMRGNVGDVADNSVDKRSRFPTFEAVTGSRDLVFPADHGPHRRQRTEWWYFTGNLESDSSRPFGFQLTFFRVGVEPNAAKRRSAWASNDLYMAHFALTDVSSKVFHSSERFSRAALDMAGASARPFAVWLEDWQVATLPHAVDRSVSPSPDPDGIFPLQLQAKTENSSISLELTPEKALVLQGEDGYSQKSANPANASLYYSYTRLRAKGVVHLDEGATPVTGSAWMDREWSTSALAANQVGWDWFALQLDDGSDFMYYRMRLDDGKDDPMSAGVIVAPNGRVHRLSSSDVYLEVLETWNSPLTAARYPTRWRIRVTEPGMEVEVAARMDNQEHSGVFRYWEGAVTVSGNVSWQQAGDQRVNVLEPTRAATGVGYVELTGY